MTLFRRLARRHGEWLAQGVFLHAFEADAHCRALVLARLGLPMDETEYAVDEEDLDEVTSWRVDVSVSGGDVRKRIELKLAAPLTPRQVEALRLGKIDLFVVPAPRAQDPALGSVARVTWAELAECAAPGMIKSLLQSVDEDSNWHVLSEQAATLSEDFGRFLSGDTAAGWRRMYLFLSTLDAMLAREYSEYASGPGWSKSTNGWYGFAFNPGPRVDRHAGYWIGLSQETTGGGAAFALALYAGNKPMHFWPLEGKLNAADLVRELAGILPRA